MEKTTEKLSADDSAANNQPESSTQENKNDDQSKESEAALLKKFLSFEDELEKEIRKDGDQKEQNEEKLKFIKKKLKKLRSSLRQYEKQHRMDKKSSFSQQQWLLASLSREMSKDWQDLQLEKHILVSPMMSNLQISYDLLPSRSRLSLLRFAVFPEKTIIKKRPLIYWWTAEDLATKSARKTAQEAGEEILQELIGKSLIQPWYKSDKTPKSLKNNCTVNPWNRRMLISIATRAEFFDFDGMGKITNNFTKSRCLCLAKDNDWSSTNNNLKDLSTIFNVNESCLTFREQFFLDSKKLRVLQLGRWQVSPFHHIEVENDKFLNELRVLKHLKYLSLRGISRISALPSSITECRNLEILDLKACHNLETLPYNVSSWRKLTHLDMSECYLLESMPSGLEHLSSLQVLKGFILGVSGSPTKLEGLAPMEKLRKLSLLVTRKSDSQLASRELYSFSLMSRAGNLKNLTITWRMDMAEEDNQSFIYHHMDAEFLKKLEKLDLRRYPYKKSQEWLQAYPLENLKRLYIRGGKLQELISDKEWESVEILRLKYLKDLKLEAAEVHKIFPRLIYYED